jgi:Zn-dependent protease
MESIDLAALAGWYVAFIVSLTFHEAAHALAALWGGDDTAYRGGQVSLNPWPHVRREPLGTVIVPIISFFISGWTLGWGSAPYDPRWARRNPLRAACMSAAGPAANFLLALIAFGVLKALLAADVFAPPSRDQLGLSSLVVPAGAYAGSAWAPPLAMLLSIFLGLNVLLGLFNLLPLPPLDGSGILEGLFPNSVGRALDWLRMDSMFSLLGILVAWKVFDSIGPPALSFVLLALW